MCARRPKHRLPCPVGDRGLQVTPIVSQRRKIQADLWNFHRIQGDRLEDCQRVEALEVWGRAVVANR